MQLNIGQELLRKGASLRIQLLGSSMLPIISSGDWAFIKPVTLEKVRVGDILAYVAYSEKQAICHRLLKIEGSHLIVKGDACPGSCENILPGSLLGKVIYIEHNGNKINLETKTQLFLASKIAWVSFRLPLLALVIIYFIKAIKEPRLVPIKLIRKIRKYVAVY